VLAQLKAWFFQYYEFATLEMLKTIEEQEVHDRIFALLLGH